jgi:hypothetical protein
LGVEAGEPAEIMMAETDMCSQNEKASHCSSDREPHTAPTGISSPLVGRTDLAQAEVEQEVNILAERDRSV